MPDSTIASAGVADMAPAPSGSKYDRLIAEAKRTTAPKAIVVHPCDETSLRGAIEAANAGLINPMFVGPAAKIDRIARDHQLDIGKFELVDVAHSDAAAAKAVELIRASQGELLMKGSLHTDELMRPIGIEIRPADCRGKTHSRNAYDNINTTRATGKRNDAPPMIVVFNNSFRVSFHLDTIIKTDAEIRLTNPNQV